VQLLTWIKAHKAMLLGILASVAVGLNHMVAFVPHPWDGYLTAAALICAQLSGGPVEGVSDFLSPPKSSKP
jgi:hypothetical protein